MKNIVTALTLFALLVGALITTWGLVHLQWPQAIPWLGRETLIRFFGLLFVFAALVYIGSWRSRRSALFAAFAVAVGVALMAGALWSLIVALWLIIASALLGRYVLTVLRIRTAVDNWLVNFLVGAGIYGTSVGLLAHFPVSYSGVYGVALALPLVLGWRVIREESQKFLAMIGRKAHDEFKLEALNAAIAAVALGYFIVALMPEIGYDALAYHLFVPAHLALRHQWGFDVTTYIWAVFPMLGEWIFSFGYMLAGETAARLINISFIFILGWLVRDIVLWAGGSIVGARWAVLIYLSMPLTFTEGSSLYIDSVSASFILAGTLFVLRVITATGNQKIELPVAGLLLGFALAAKAVTYMILPALLLLLIWRHRSWYKATGLNVLLYGLSLFFVLGCVPYVTAWWLTGNPVFPLFNKIFQSPYFPSGSSFSNPLYHSGTTWDVLYRVTFDSGKYLEATAGASGFQWLMLFIPAVITLIALKHFKGLLLLFIGTLSIVAAFHFQSYLRYTFPFWTILAAVIGVALSTILSAKTILRNCCYAALAITVVLNLIFFSAGSPYRDFSLQPIGDEARRAQYLTSHLPLRNAVKLVNQINVGQMPVAVFSHPMAAGLAADAIFPNWYNLSFQSEIMALQTEQELVNTLQKRNINLIVLDSGWNGVGNQRGAETRASIEKITSELANFGSVSVRRVKSNWSESDGVNRDVSGGGSEKKNPIELLINPDFKSINGWALAEGAKYDAKNGVVLVSVASSASQLVEVSPGQHYLNSVIARCAQKPTSGRIQINWFDAQMQMVSTNISVFECSPKWKEHTMSVTVPSTAAHAFVYTSGHTEIPLEFKRNSLK